MNKGVSHPRIILASKSPRRRDLLEKAGLKFTVIPSELDESAMAVSSPESYVKSLAAAKAGQISDRYPDSWIIGADTVVFNDSTILGKPASRDEARVMLESLSGKTHQVHTGYCICNQTENHHFSDCVSTDVHFKELSKTEIDWYIDTGEPFDKAGSYAIQGIGTVLVRSINGSYTNVVGLPVCEVLEHLIKEGIVERTLT